MQPGPKSIGIVATMSLWLACNSTPPRGAQPRGPANALGQADVQRWLYTNLDSVSRLVQWNAFATAQAHDTAGNLANHCLLAEAIVFHNAPDGLALVDSLGKGPNTLNGGWNTHWSNYYAARYFEAQRHFTETDSLLNLLLSTPRAQLGEDLYLRAKTMELRLSGCSKKYGSTDSLAESLLLEIPSDGHFRLLAELMLASATAHLEGGKPKLAENLLSTAKSQVEKTGDPEMEGRRLLSLAYAQCDQGHYDQCSITAAQSIRCFAQAGDARSPVQCRKLIGFCQWGVLGPVEVLDNWLPALRAADSLGLDREAAILRIQLARFRVDLDSAASIEAGFTFSERFPAAYALVQDAENAARRINDMELLAMAIQAQAAFLNHENRFHESNRLQEEALSTFKAVGNETFVISSMLGIASNEISLRHWERAVHWLDQALEMADRGQFNNLRLLALNRLAHVYRQLDRYDRALDYKEKWWSLKDSLQGLEVVEKVAQAELHQRYAQKLFSDSLANVQRATMERQVAMGSIQRLRWRSFWLAGGVLLLAVGGSTGFILDRRRRRERFAKEAALLETKALRAQMDPHFIGNTLHAVNGYLLTHDPAMASTLLSRFAKWIRTTLESSRKEEVELREDIEAMRTYLALEQTRTSDQFTYSIDVPDKEDLLRAKIPPMLIQPFVENAILHGVLRRKEPGHVCLRVEDREDHLLVTVEDNGVGCTAGPVPTEAKSSVSTAVTRERLRLLGEQTGKPAGVQITALEPGTRVVLEIPLA
jgi:tetratricopeptide (TPR) repeat protein